MSSPASQLKRSQVSAKSSHNSQTSLIGGGGGSPGASKPPGVRLFGRCFKFQTLLGKRTFHRALVLILTYIAYTAFHMGRRPLSIVKNVLNRKCSAGADDESPAAAAAAAAIEQEDAAASSSSWPAAALADTSCDWAPFDDDATANQLLAVLDTAFLASYALSMFFSGMIAERTNLRHFVTFGCLMSGLSLISFGLARPLDIHSMGYFVCIQMVAGAAQSIGWPVVVTCVSNWFEPKKLGTIYGVWNSHTNLGNILGATIAGYFVERDWALSFIVPGGLMILTGLAMLLFLVPRPQDVELAPIDGTIIWHTDDKVVAICDDGGGGGFQPKPMRPSESEASISSYELDDRSTTGLNAASRPRHSQQQQPPPPPPSDGTHPIHGAADTEAAAGSIASEVPAHLASPHKAAAATTTTSSSISTSHGSGCDHNNNNNNKAVSFLTALKIPGVIEYSVCLFFSKLVSYTFLYWLPRYITSSTENNSEHSAYLSVPFDVGGVAGAIVAGYISDRYRANGITCNAMLLLAVPAMLAYQKFGALSTWNNILLQLAAGALVNGPYCLITTAVSADLSNRITDGRAMATVSAIIDGMGSIGAVLGPLFAGFVSSNSSNWNAVFLMLIGSDILAALCLTRITITEIRQKLQAD